MNLWGDKYKKRRQNGKGERRIEGGERKKRKELFLMDLNVGNLVSRETPDFLFGQRPAVRMQKVLDISGRGLLPSVQGSGNLT